jgi:hypothetical protein
MASIPAFVTGLSDLSLSAREACLRGGGGTGALAGEGFLAALAGLGESAAAPGFNFEPAAGLLTEPRFEVFERSAVFSLSVLERLLFFGGVVFD